MTSNSAEVDLNLDSDKHSAEDVRLRSDSDLREPEIQADIAALDTDRPFDPNLHVHFTVVIKKEPLSSLGVTVQNSGEGTLRLDSISEGGGVISEWNKKYPRRAVRPGDHIFGVNSVYGDVVKMSQECYNSSVLELRMRRRAEEPLPSEKGVSVADNSNETIDGRRKGSTMTWADSDFGLSNRQLRTANSKSKLQARTRPRISWADSEADGAPRSHYVTPEEDEEEAMTSDSSPERVDNAEPPRRMSWADSDFGLSRRQLEALRDEP
eukprot:CAMPEP_0170646206 /NCGR_PEP_ID=MMETSP0224-20130122/43507_1 /TAXON_ID=285029 /ORGANISM="Togula jolla, Strain CCCM 725" /LENGTH=266 /DNA_ID=CAMNT_0010977509 /DNA_START=78 /DNA_END=875 /DNA_ORIENTATION=-